MIKCIIMETKAALVFLVRTVVNSRVHVEDKDINRCQHDRSYPHTSSYCHFSSNGCWSKLQTLGRWKWYIVSNFMNWQPLLKKNTWALIFAMSCRSWFTSNCRRDAEVCFNNCIQACFINVIIKVVNCGISVEHAYFITIHDILFSASCLS